MDERAGETVVARYAGLVERDASSAAVVADRRWNFPGLTAEVRSGIAISDHARIITACVSASATTQNNPAISSGFQFVMINSPADARAAVSAFPTLYANSVRSVCRPSNTARI
jgi:hypothetical protein